MVNHLVCTVIVKVKVCGLIVFDLTDLSHYFLGPKDSAKTPTLDKGLEFVSQIPQDLLKLKRAEVCANIPTTEMFLDLCRAFCYVKFQHSFSHLLN